MLHPHTELRFVSPAIGYGIFATQLIPKGTMTWVKDELDRVFTKKEIDSLAECNRSNLLKYTYRNNRGNYIFCWDLTRYVNHSHEANCFLTALDFEIAIRNIEIGEELTNDYGSLNIIEAFKCANDTNNERKFVKPDDLKKFSQKWDEQILEAMKFYYSVAQPLNDFLTTFQLETLHEIKAQKIFFPSIVNNYYEDG